MTQNNTFNRRKALKTLAAGAAAGAALGFPAIVRGQGAKIKIGLMLPYSGTFSIYGESITNSFTMAMKENAGKFGGREIDRLIPRDGFPLAVLAKVRPSHAIRCMHEVERIAPLDAEVASTDRRVHYRLDDDETSLRRANRHLATNAAIGTDRPNP